MSESPVTQSDHDEAVGVGCLLMLIAMTPLIVAGLALCINTLIPAVASVLFGIPS